LKYFKYKIFYKYGDSRFLKQGQLALLLL